MGQWFTLQRRPNGYAVIATILLVAVVVVVSLRWSTIDATRQRGLGIEELAAQLSEQHRRLGEGDVSALLLYESMERAAAELSGDLGMERLRVFDLTAAGLDFAAAGMVESAAGAVAGHVFYHGAARDGVGVSVFLVPNRGAVATGSTLPMPDGREVWVGWEGRRGDAGDIQGLMGSDQTMVYVLMSEDEGALQAAATRIARIVTQRWRR